MKRVKLCPAAGGKTEQRYRKVPGSGKLPGAFFGCSNARKPAWYLGSNGFRYIRKIHF